MARRFPNLVATAATMPAILPATSHTAAIGRAGLMMGFIGPFLAGEAPKGWSD